MLKSIAKFVFFIGLALVILSQYPTLLKIVKTHISGDSDHSTNDKQVVESFYVGRKTPHRSYIPQGSHNRSFSSSYFGFK